MISITYMLFLGACFLSLVYGILRSYINETEGLAEEFNDPSLRLHSAWYTLTNLLPGGVIVCLLASGAVYVLQ